jgi:DNA polymerase V
MQTLEELSPTVEYYSIDEAFIPLSLYSSQDYDTWAEKVRDTIMQYTGIPVSIGIAPSRTLAKAANEFAKKWEICNGVFSFVGMSEEKVAYYLQQLPVEAVWGIGYKSARTLQAAAIYTAHDLTQTCESTIRKYLKIMGVRTRAELLGTSCITLSENRAPKKGILSSRSFGKKVMKLEELGEAVASYIDTACHKLRKQDCVARILTIYIRSSLYSKTQAYYSKSMTLALPIASNYTAIFITHGLSMLKKIFKPGVTYAKAGVFLSEISPQTAVQQHLFLTQENSKIPLRQNISNAIDSVRKRYGEKSIGFAAAGIEKKWQGKNEQRTPRYTTQITELLFAS